MKGLLEPGFLPKPVSASRETSMPRGSRMNRIICTLSVLFAWLLVYSHYYGSYDRELHHQPSTPGGTSSGPSKFRSSAPTNHSSFATAASSSFHNQPTAKPRKASVDALGAPLTKPAGIPMIAVIFYGRRHRASILECYLRNNLASHGGWLDEVIWAVNTDNEGDRVYAQGIAESALEYRYLPISTPDEENETCYTQVWYDAFKNESSIYLKIDDDVVFAEDNAIPRMVTTLMKNPAALLVSSNVIKNHALGWVHYHMGTMHPYMPELVPMTKHLARMENGVWRPSELPRRIEPPQEPLGVNEYHYMFDVENEDDIPKHRWYPVNDYNYLRKTPVAASEYNAFGNNLYYWPLAAQAHYSLLQNIEENGLDCYYMVHNIAKRKNGPLSTWRMTGTRLSTNFMAIRGLDVFAYRDTIARNDEEQTLTVDLPGEIGRSVPVETTSIVAHFSFGPQKGVAATDLLERYHNYAKERMCPAGILEP